MNFWANLDELGWSQAKFADVFGLSKATLSNWRKAGVPTWAQVIADYLVRMKRLSEHMEP